MKPKQNVSLLKSASTFPEIEKSDRDSATKGTQQHFVTNTDVTLHSAGPIIESDDEKDLASFLPDCWNMKQYNVFKKKYNGLIVKRKKLGCQFCSQFESLHMRRIHVSKEWGSCSVGPAGRNKIVQQASLRKKMNAHFLSKAHKICVKSLQDSDVLNETHTATASKVAKIRCRPSRQRLVGLKMRFTDTTEIEVQDTHASERDAELCSRDLIASTCNIFNTVYSLSKRNGSFSDFTKEIELQVKNGVDMNLELSSQDAALNVADHIANEIKQTIILKIIEQNLKICVVVDEILTISTKPVLVVFLNVEDPGLASSVFLDLVELEDQNTEAIYMTLFKCLHDAGFDEKYLSNNLIAFCSNGASEMLGHSSGLICRFKIDFPHIVVWHCLSHSLRFSLDDSINLITQVNYLKVFIEKLITIFHQSNKSQLQLFHISKELGLEILKIGNVLGLRWATGSLKIALAVSNAYPALQSYFCTEEKQFDIAALLCNKHFFHDLALMIDILQEIHSLSTALQSRNLSLFKAENLIKTSITSFEMLRKTKGVFEKKIDEVVASEVFSGVKFIDDHNFACIPRQKLLDAIIENMKKQLMSYTDSKPSTNYKQEHPSDIHRLLNLFEPDSWTIEDVVSPGQAAEEKLSDFKKIFRHEISIDDFRDYVDNVLENVHRGKKFEIPSTIQKAKDIIKTISVNSEAVEIGLSKMNTIYFVNGSRIEVSNVASMLTIGLNGLPLQSWNAADSVSSWMRKQHPADESKPAQNQCNECNDNQEASWKFLK